MFYVKQLCYRGCVQSYLLIRTHASVKQLFIVQVIWGSVENIGYFSERQRASTSTTPSLLALLSGSQAHILAKSGQQSLLLPFSVVIDIE